MGRILGYLRIRDEQRPVPLSRDLPGFLPTPRREKVCEPEAKPGLAYGKLLLHNDVVNLVSVSELLVGQWAEQVAHPPITAIIQYGRDFGRVRMKSCFYPKRNTASYHLRIHILGDIHLS